MKDPNLMDATLRIGKKGVYPGIVDEIKKQLKRHKVIKIKFLRTVPKEAYSKTAVESLAEEVRAVVVDRIGGVVVLAKR